LRSFCALALLFKLRVDCLLLLLHKLCLQEPSELLQRSGRGQLEDLVDRKFFVCLHSYLAGFLQGLLLDERDLDGAGKRMRKCHHTGNETGTILFISLSTSSSFSGLDAISKERQVDKHKERG
jgi:hypothetical protein